MKRWIAAMAIGLVPVLLVACAGPKDFTKIRSVYKETDSPSTASCAFRGRVEDDDMEDLLKKAHKIGGDSVVLRRSPYSDYLAAEVFKCY